MNNTKEYEYVMELSEIREFCRFTFVEQLKCNKRTWLRVLLIIALTPFLVPHAAVVPLILMIGWMIVIGVSYYRSTVKLLRGQLWTVYRIQDGRLRVARSDYSEIPCKDICFIRRTKRLLMLGYMQGPRRPAWFVMPLRIFGDEQELAAFLALIRNPQAEGESAFAEPSGNGEKTASEPEETMSQEYMRFSYLLDGERWVRFQKGAADLLNGGSLGRPTRIYGAIIFGCVMTAAMFISMYLIVGTLGWPLVCYCLALILWMCLRLFFRDPEKRIRKQIMAPEIANHACGVRQVSLGEEGITVNLPMNMKDFYSWTSLEWLLETEEVFYIFHKDKKHFIMIAKECFASWEQVDVFHRICADHGVRKIAPKRAHYVPTWLTWTVFALIILVSAGVLVARIYLDFIGGIFDRQVPMTGGLAGMAAGDGLVRVPLAKQVEVLASLGLDVPEETVESVRSSMVEYDLYDMVEESPYTWLLMDMGMPSYDEDWNLVGYSSEVFWFDFEGVDLSTDYIDILNGMLALAQGSPLDSVSDIRENTENVDWEKGSGTVTVSLNWEGQDYHYDMEVYYDWIDGEVLSLFNELLEGQDWQKRFYAMGDNGQGAIVFFCTEEWAEEFTLKTGLELE